MVSAQHVLLERRGPVAHIVLNRPDTLNALTVGMHDMETDEVREFKRRVGQEGIKAALAWRDAWNARLVAGGEDRA